MRIASGVTDQYIYFVAVDSSDLKTRETGLSGFTVYRSRNGGAAAAYTTPTINETDGTNMPGVYELLLDEDMTIDSGDEEQEVCLHITHASMAPVTRIFTLFRPKITAGETLTVSSGIGSVNVTQFGGTNGTFSSGRPEVNTTHAAGTAWGSGAITASTFGTGAITNAKLAAGAISATTFATGAITATTIAADAIGASGLATDAVNEIASAIWAAGVRSLTTGANIVLAKGTGITGFNDLSAAQVNAEVDTALADYDAPTNAEMNARTLLSTEYATATALQTVDDNVDAILVDTGTTLDAALSVIDSNIDAILVDTGTDIPASLSTINTKLDTIDNLIDTEVSTIDTTLNALVTDIGANGSGLTAIPWNTSWDAEVESEVTDALTAYDVATSADISGASIPTVVQIADEIETRVIDANIVQVNDVEVTGAGTENNPWGP